MRQFSNSFPKHFSYLCEYAIRFDLSCSFCEYPFIFHCLHCSPSCFDPDSLLLAYLWLGLSWIDCISANKSFSSSKTSSRKPYTSSKQQERQKHSVEITINLESEERRRVYGPPVGAESVRLSSTMYPLLLPLQCVFHSDPCPYAVDLRENGQRPQLHGVAPPPLRWALVM